MSDNYSLIIKNGSCYIEGKFQNIDIALSGSKIKKIGKISLNNTKVIDASGKIVLPGVIDTQVHFREPGANDAENLESGSRAAIAGGVTSEFGTSSCIAPLTSFSSALKKSSLEGPKTACSACSSLGLPCLVSSFMVLSPYL